jgi:hypothetical protein
MRIRAGLLTLLCVLLPVSTVALSPTAGTGITLYGGERLTPTGAATLRELLTALPITLYPHLEAITIDDATAPSTETPCDVSPWRGPCQIHIWSDGESIMEDSFPVDAPERVSASQFYTVAAHELGHAMSFWAWFHRSGTWWEKRLIEEAGCEPSHYLRSMFSQCFFRDYPQELFASMMNQWAVCSECTLSLALARWDRGIPHPLNQLIALLWLFGSITPSDTRWRAGTVLAYRAVDRMPMVELWTVRPWACGTTVTVTGPTFALILTTDAECRVVSVGTREGL